MNAQDFRIGNWIEPLTKSPCKITGINHKKVLNGDLVFIYADYESFLPEHIIPIPLTEEWLKRFGFEVFEFDYKDNQYRFKDRLIVIRDGHFQDYGSSVTIKYLHELQNLFFCLTGTELTIKP